jgi:hypothetical protein
VKGELRQTAAGMHQASQSEIAQEKFGQLQQFGTVKTSLKLSMLL